MCIWLLWGRNTKQKFLFGILFYRAIRHFTTNNNRIQSKKNYDETKTNYKLL